MKPEQNENLILLSKIAKEKKYAQEYLGLLARRGDIGSIRIGKRWFTTREWFDEFLNDAKKEKSEAPVQPAIKMNVAVKDKEIVEIKSIAPAPLPVRAELNEIKTEKTSPIPKFEALPVRNKTQEISNAKDVVRVFAPVNLRVARPAESRTDIKRVPLPPVIAPKMARQNVSRVQQQHATHPFFNVRQEEVDILENLSKNLKTPPKKFQFERLDNNFSPNFSGKRFSLFQALPRLAFATAFLLLLSILSASLILYKKDLGTVAGAADVKMAGIANLAGSAATYFESRKEISKENVSLSELAVRTALESQINSENAIASR